VIILVLKVDCSIAMLLGFIVQEMVVCICALLCIVYFLI